jgi:hypothetical protein
MDNGRRGFRRVVTLLAIAVAAALVWVVLTTFWMWRYQERVVFQPPGIFIDAAAPAVRVEYNASDGHSVFGYLVAPSRESEALRTEGERARHGTLCAQLNETAAARTHAAAAKPCRRHG